MFKCGALVVNSKSNKLIPSLNAAARLVKEVLYVPLASEHGPSTGLKDISQKISELYLHISKINPQLDLRVILPNSQPSPSPFLSTTVEALLSPLLLQDVEELPEYSCIKERSNNQDIASLFKPLMLNDSLETLPDLPPTNDIRPYSDVALGGTFDSIHNGHRLLLAQAALVSTRRILVGVASGPLLANKTLMELIKPVEFRISEILRFLNDCKPELVMEVVPITDVFGPTAWDGDLKCLIASRETASAITVINEEREKKNLQPLSLHTIELVAEGENSPSTLTNKTSSSELRKKQLAVLRTPKINRCLSSWDAQQGPYLIGLTGNTACGKSSVTKRLADLGAHPIPCDQLGHKAYLPGTEGHSEIVKEFGKEILNDSGEVDRKRLGAIVFSDKTKLTRLNEIVWPAIWTLVEEEVKLAASNGFKVCVVDAAVLLQAQWDRKVHEVWVLVISSKESIKRVMERDGLTEERARQRLSSQTSGAEAIEHAHIVLSTQWEYSYTQAQVNKAWEELQSRLHI